MWDKFVDTAKSISHSRSDCVTPRGVLEKMYSIVVTRSGFDRDVICGNLSGDFDWFRQRGKVYADGRYFWTRYANLHLARAYELMPSSERMELQDILTPHGKGKEMIGRGFDALEDAFNVVRRKGVFNIFNSDSGEIEEFNPTRAHVYSQAQCAIVIERVFSELYKYL